MRDAVRRRARDRCEYCRIRQRDAPFVKHQVEHVIPRQHSGSDDLANLALACYRWGQQANPDMVGIHADAGVLLQRSQQLPHPACGQKRAVQSARGEGNRRLHVGKLAAREPHGACDGRVSVWRRAESSRRE